MNDSVTSKNLWRSATLCVAIALLGTACGNSRSAAGSAGESAGGKAEANSAAACPASASKPLADGATIKIGMSTPMSGPLASAGLTALGMKAYFKAVNDKGGIDGHKIELITRDDAFDAARALANAQTFTGKDNVLATVNQIGTPQINAAQPVAEKTCTPQLWSITSTTKGLTDPEKHPWSTLGIAPAAVEAQAVVDYIRTTKPSGTVMELTGPDALSTDFHASFPALAKKAGLTVLPNQSIAAGATSVDGPVAAMVAAKPDAVFLETLPNYCPGFLKALATAGYKGIVAVNSACNGAAQWITPVDPAGDGVVAPMFRKDPADPRYADDPAMKQYRKDMAALGAKAQASIGNALDGYNFGVLLVQNLKDAAGMKGGLTRVNLMKAAWHTKVTRPLSISPRQRTDGATDPVLLEAGRVDRYSAKTNGWKSTSTTFDLEGHTPLG
ncbi:ABC transporter substrate-binding protein [Streptomyces sp. NPDC006476]|uniref:ABC transporter substrate-binding protein n=1 Tax=Streptomyces sp. NPDC006476 TaxID=3157175 RepID=UPI0033BC50D3